MKFVAGNAEAARFLRAQAFTVATVENDRIRTALKESLDDALKTGKSLEEWKRTANDVFDKEGVSRLSNWHLQVVYRTNAQLAFAAAQIAMLERTRDAFPYWRYSAIMDRRTRPSHAALNGKIFRVGDWTYFPPLGFNCRCGAIPISKSKAASLGIKEPSKLSPDARAALRNIEFIGDKNAKFADWLNRQPLSKEAQGKLAPQLAILTAALNQKPSKAVLKERESLYYNPPKNYTSIYYNGETGGLVLQHSQHNLEELQSELQIAKAYAEQGVLVELLPERKQPQGVKTPDAQHNQKDIWEYKSITEDAATLRTSAGNKISQAIKQGVRNVAILIDREKYDIQEINRGILLELEKDTTRRIQNFSLIFRGKIQSIKIKDWINGERFSRF